MDEKLIRFSDSPFDQISLEHWYAISSLRERVFVVEQKCPYLDADGKDLQAHHIIGMHENGAILAYARIVHHSDELIPNAKMEYVAAENKERLLDLTNSKGVFIQMPAIGRVVLDSSVRGNGKGDALMKYTLQCCSRIHGDMPIFISAQAPLHDFYTLHGFIQSGPGYLEDNIPHIPMLYGI